MKPLPEPHTLKDTWIEVEEYAYPSGGFLRRGRVRVRPNPNNPIALPYGELRAIRCSIPDTFFSIPARLRYRGQVVKGFVSVHDDEYTFTPDGLGTP